LLHPDTELKLVDEHIGYGVFATRPIPRGTITWVRCPLDQTLTPAKVARMPAVTRAQVRKYSFIDGRGDLVLCWDLARFVNHSCNATCLSGGYQFEVAVRDIAAGEELTDDYGTLNLDCAFDCACGLPQCRGRVLPDDPERLWEYWDGLVKGALPLIPQLEQPLWPLVREKKEVGATIAGRIEMLGTMAQYIGNQPISGIAARLA